MASTLVLHLVASLVEKNDAAQLDLLRRALVVQIEESKGTREDLGALVELIESRLRTIDTATVPSTTSEPLTAKAIQEQFTTRLRGGVQLLMKYQGLSGDEAILGQASRLVTQAYVRFCQDSQHTELLPTVDAIQSEGDILEHYNRLLHNKRILSSDIQAHLAERTGKFASERDQEAYIEDQHHRARTKLACTWAAAARAYLDVATRAKQLSSTLAEQEEGRDTTGRLGYLLMTTSSEDLFAGLTGGNDIKEGVSDRTGIVKFALDIADVFSTAACHKDAEQMMTLMADRLFVKGQADLPNDDATKPLLTTIMSALTACPGKQCVLKLTNKQNHSAVYLVGDPPDTRSTSRRGVKLDTVAGQNSDDILYNKLIEGSFSLRDVEVLVREGLQRIAMAWKWPSTLNWEVHTATDLQTMFGRVDTTLRQGATALGVGLAVGEFERRERDLGSGGIVKQGNFDFVVPLQELESSHAKVYSLRDDTALKPVDVRRDEQYQVSYCSSALMPDLEDQLVRVIGRPLACCRTTHCMVLPWVWVERIRPS